MSRLPGHHPLLERLRAFRLGHLSEEELEAIGAHLAECAACCEVVEQRDEAIFSRLRGAAWERDATRPARAVPTPADRCDAETQDASSASGASVLLDLAVLLSPPQGPGEIGRLGRYRVLKLLGRGGMGAVFVAEDTLLHRAVALKVMLPELARRAEAEARFLREARAVAAIEHDHVVAILDIGQERGVLYLAMPLLKGVALEDRLSRGAPLSWPQIVRIGRQVAEGLAAAHAKGLVHRDVKPSNLWLEAPGEEASAADFGRVKLLDFGLVWPHTTEPGLTGSGLVVGTPSYMAPEQARGERIDGRADLFSLGVILYRLCTGRLPFEGTSAMSVLTALATEAPPPPHAVNGAVPPALSTLIMELLAKDPAHRPASARVVADRLRQMESELPRRAAPATAPGRRARRWWVAAAVAVAVPLAVWLAGARLGPDPRGATTLEVSNPDPPALAVAPFGEDEARAAQEAWAKHLGTSVEVTHPIGMRFRLIPPGRYFVHPQMLRGPQPTSNQLNEPFYIGVYDVTVAEFRRFVTETKHRTVAEKLPIGGYRWGGKFSASGSRPEYIWSYPEFAQSANAPVVLVHWHDAEAFCRWLGSKDGREYRLPTESELHWATRAGTGSRYFFGDDEAALEEYGWFDSNSRGKSHPVGQKKANPWGLYDVYGNVWQICREWCPHDQSRRLTVLDNPTGPSATELQICLGGNYAEGIDKASVYAVTTSPMSHVGFRVYLSCRPSRR